MNAANHARSLPAGSEAARFAGILRDRLPQLRAGHGVASLSLFGSYVRNEQRPDSDLDVLVEFARGPSLFELVSLEDELSSMLGVRVEIVLRSELRPRLARYILREAVPV